VECAKTIIIIIIIIIILLIMHKSMSTELHNSGHTQRLCFARCSRH